MAIANLIDQFQNREIFFPNVTQSLKSIEFTKVGQKKVLLVMPKGEVHDIGKTVIDALFRLNGFEVINLGSVKSTDQLFQAIDEYNPDCVGLSGMLTTSLCEMQEIAQAFQKKGLTIPLLIGGAGTSLEHTAAFIAPHYTHGLLIHVKDLYHCHEIIPVLQDYDTKDRSQADNNQLREAYITKLSTKKIHTLEDARERGLKIDWKQEDIAKPPFLGVKVIDNLELGSIIELIDWTPLFLAFGLKEKFPHVLTHKDMGVEASKLFEDAKRIMHNLVNDKIVEPKAVIGFFAANSDGDDIQVYEGEAREKVIKTFHTIRQQAYHTEGKPYYALADFIAPKSTQINDYIGFFALTTGLGIGDRLKELEENHDYYNLIITKVMTDRLAEAFAEKLHEKVRKEYWGYAAGEKLTEQEMFQCRFRGIRPAPGYPACPEHSEKKDLFELLDIERTIGIKLTETYAMDPASSVCGLYFAHPQSQYYWLGTIGRDQVEDIAKRKGWTQEQAKKALAMNLSYLP